MNARRLVSMVAVVIMGLGLSWVGSGCTKNPQDSSAWQRDTVKAHLEAGRWLPAFRMLASDVQSTHPTTKASAMALITQYAAFIPGVLTELQTEIDHVASPGGAIVLQSQIERLQETGLAPTSQIDHLVAALTHAVREGNRSGRVAFLFDDHLSTFPALAEPTALAIIFERSLCALEDPKRPPSHRLVVNTFAYVKTQGHASQAFQRLEQALPNIAFSKDHLKTVVKELYPAFADRALQDLLVPVHLTTDPRHVGYLKRTSPHFCVVDRTCSLLCANRKQAPSRSWCVNCNSRNARTPNARKQ